MNIVSHSATECPSLHVQRTNFLCCLLLLAHLCCWHPGPKSGICASFASMSCGQVGVPVLSESLDRAGVGAPQLQDLIHEVRKPVGTTRSLRLGFDGVEFLDAKGAVQRTPELSDEVR